MEISPGIYRIGGLSFVNAYLVINGPKMLLVDTGMPGSAKKIVNYIRSLGKNPADVEYIVITHGDIDHIGGAAEMKQLTGARIAIHAGDAPFLSGESGLRRVKGPIGAVSNFFTRLLPFRPVAPDILLEDGVEIGGFKIIYTPGHTTGSICLYLPRRVIFVGDALSSDSKGNPQPLRKRKYLSTDIAQANASFKKISQLDFDICLAGHGTPVIGNASDRLRSLLV